MKEYAIVMASTLLLAWMLNGTRVGAIDSPGTRNKNRICYFLIFVILTLFVGLRTTYNDTFVYLQVYNQSAEFPEFWKSFSPELGANPGFAIVQAWLKTNGAAGQTFLLFFSTLSVAGFLYFLKNYSNDFLLSLFLFFATNAYTLTAAALKQSVAIAISLLAVTCALKKKWIPFVLLMALAATFHPYVLLFALVPFLTFKPWSRWTYVLLGVFITAGFALESLLGTIVDITAMIGDNYTEEALIGEGINVFRVLVCNVPLVLTFLYRKQLFADSTKAEHLMINLAMLNGAIMFVGLFGTSIYFSRMASYFTIAQCVALPWILKKIPFDHKKLFTTLMVIGYAGFFVYANIISQSFDDNFNRITLWEYLSRYVMG